MRCVVDDMLWIGNAADARDAAKLIGQGFNVVVDLALDEPPALLPRELIYLRFPIIDGVGNDKPLLVAAIKTTAILLSLTGLKTAVCCSAGLSRSPAVVAGAIALSKGSSPDEALLQVRARASCDVSPALWIQVVEVCNSLRS